MVGSKRSEVERRASILRAARAVALRESLGAVSGRSVAEEAGLSSGLVYFYFGTKEQLLLSLLDELLAEALDGPEPGYGEDLSPDAAMYGMFVGELTDLAALREVIDLIFQFFFLRHDDLFRRPIADGFVRYGAAMRPIIQRHAAVHDLDPEALRYTVVTLIEGAAVEIIRSPDLFSAQRLLEVLRALTVVSPRHRPR